MWTAGHSRGNVCAAEPQLYCGHVSGKIGRDDRGSVGSRCSAPRKSFADGRPPPQPRRLAGSLLTSRHVLASQRRLVAEPSVLSVSQVQGSAVMPSHLLQHWQLRGLWHDHPSLHAPPWHLGSLSWAGDRCCNSGV
eukprot:2883955-Amphidinium_carterae.1